MPSSFCPRMVNGPFGDPGLFVSFAFRKRALLFDLGDLSCLGTRDLLKVSHVFISHTHMDHMIGFDRLLRLLLGREKRLHLFGPPGLIRNVEGKLAGYTWNLVENYGDRFHIDVSEIASNTLKTVRFSCHKGFRPDTEPVASAIDGRLIEEPDFTIATAELDHLIPCFGYRLDERFRINIIKTELDKLGLETGPWLTEFKTALYRSNDPSSEFTVPTVTPNAPKRRFRLADLADRIAVLSPGRTIAYITDAVFSRANLKRMTKLAENADHLFIEAAFLDRDRRIAERTYHLTAGQAGTVAGNAGAKRFTLFHFSPRYKGEEKLFLAEANEAYRRTTGKRP